MIFTRMLSRRWILTTLLVIAAVVVMIRLGFWQLDRLEQRRAFNARVQAQLNMPPLELNGAALQADLHNMEYRDVIVRGEYDHSQEIAIRNQAMDGQWGVHLVTPLVIEGTERAILVDRGWIPAEDYTSGDWSKYAEPGVVEVRGVIRRSQSRPDFGPRSDPTPVPGGEPVKSWNFVNVEAIDQQVSYDLLPAYIQQAPSPSWTGLPARTAPQLNLTEGSHLGYALQWFAFAAILGIGYPFFIQRQEKSAGSKVDPAQKNGRANQHASVSKDMDLSIRRKS
ncbi:MAG: SURF1 family protein [Chloroflexi bacterium]|jgi:surfeit locus 1 family protein|nr:SURF1 family protein [Chloroflexota bacterium]